MLDVINDFQSGCVSDAVTGHALKEPDDIALTHGFQALTYGELNRRSNRLANHLRSLGVRVESRVGLCLPRSLEMAVGALGILKAGAAYVPMDPANPADRLAFMLDDAQAPVLITSPSIAQRLPPARREIVNINAAQITAEPDCPPVFEKAPGDLAYIIYTSGSTGRPKGVEITHASLANLISWHQAAFSITPADRASHLAGLGFDAAVWELWPYLASGASVHLADETTRISPEFLRDWLLAQRITISFVVTPLAERLLALEWPRTSALRLLLTGGDTLRRNPPPHLPFVLVNNYGPTECTVVATSGTVDPDGKPTGALPSIGRAIANTEIHILDERRERVPDGTPGEIYIGGAGLARGYHNRPDLTADKFVANPFSADPRAKLFKSGDLGRFLPDGQVEFLGRVDEQIKIRGHRIEPHEIIGVLNRHPAIRESLVVAREDSSGDRQLAAYLVIVPDAEISQAGLRDFLREHLPDYMIPAVFVRIDAFTLTSHGKIDRTALPAPNAANIVPNSALNAPCTPTEQSIAKILASLLKLDEIDRNDNFFLLGGHSMLGAQLVARLRQTFDIDIDLRILFDSPTVAALSAEIERRATSMEVASERHPAALQDTSVEQLANTPHLQEPKAVSIFRRHAIQIGRLIGLVH